jgi:predicted molibdopterin-dependent oxidoreductase YjgC
VLCEDGRFRILDRPLDRLTTPLMRRDGVMTECSWDEALAAVANRLAHSPKVAGLVSPVLTNESLVAITRFFHDVLHSDEVALFHANVPPLGLGEAATLSDIDAADCIVILRANPFEHQKVLAYATRRAMDRGARLVVVDVDNPDLESLADVVVRLPQAPPREEMAPAEALNYTYHLRADRLAEIRAPLDSARSPVLMYGSGMESEFYLALRALPVKTRFLPLVRGANAIGASRLGLKARPVNGEALYVLAGDDQPGDEPLPEAAFRVVQSAFRTGWVEAADVALPAQIPFEMRGHMLNIEGHRRVVAPAVQSPAGVLPDWTTPFLLSVRLGQPLACMTVTDFAGADA